MDHATALDGHPAVVHSKIIRNFAVVGYLEYGNVRLFANLQRANLPLAPERVGAIDGRGGNGLRRRHSQLRARQRQNNRKSTRLNSSHGYISYAVFCLKKKKKHNQYS